MERKNLSSLQRFIASTLYLHCFFFVGRFSNVICLIRADPTDSKSRLRIVFESFVTMRRS